MFNTNPPPYTVGSVIEYECFGKLLRRCTVTARVDDVKNGQPGFDAIMPGGATVWGYDSQIVRVIARAEK